MLGFLGAMATLLISALERVVLHWHSSQRHEPYLLRHTVNNSTPHHPPTIARSHTRGATMKTNRHIHADRSPTSRRLTAAVLALGLVAASCGSDDDPATPPMPPTGTAVDEHGTATPAPPARPPAPTAPTADDRRRHRRRRRAAARHGSIPERCAANKAAGTITYLSSFDFAAAASILDVIVAKEKGYFDDMCLDVELKPGFSTANYPLVAASDQAQFSSAGNYTEILNYSGEGAEFVAFVDYGKTPIEALITPDGGATELAELKGKTIGVKGDIPPSIVAMLAEAGLEPRHRLQGGPARRIRSAGAARHRASTRCPCTSRTSPASSTRPA